MAKAFFVYMLATRKDGPLYVGVTSDLPLRISQHKAKVVRGFTERFNIDHWSGSKQTTMRKRRSRGKSRSSGG